MGKAGEKQKRIPKIKDKKQSERFKEAARELGADEDSGALDRIVREIANETRTDQARKVAQEYADDQREIIKRLRKPDGKH
jgi:hypothetical protein